MSSTGYSSLQFSDVGDAINVEFSNFHFSNIVKDVIHTVTGLELSEENISSENGQDFACQISSIIMLVGYTNIMISLSMSKQTASTLVAFMTGMQYTEIDDADLHDGAAELANMIAGQVKARLAQGGRHLSTLPAFTIKGNNHDILHKSKISCVSKKFRTGDVLLLAKIFTMRS